MRSQGLLAGFPGGRSGTSKEDSKRDLRRPSRGRCGYNVAVSTETHEIGQIEWPGIESGTLLEGETIDTGLSLGDAGAEDGPRQAVFLTDQRVIHLNNNGGSRSAVFVSLDDVDSVEVASQARGLGGYIWGALSLVAAFMLWQVWDSPTWSPLAGIAVILIGVYLVVDHMLLPKNVLIKIRAGATDVECGLKSEVNSEDTRAFVNRLFQLKNVDRASVGERPFAPR